MNILHFVLGKANKQRANGVNQVIAGLAKYTASLGISVRVIGKAQSVSHEGEVILRDGFSVEAYSDWATPLKNALRRDIAWADVVHLHGAYSGWNLLVGRMCEKASKPYILTLHNGLAPSLAERHGFRKAIYHSLFQRRHLAKAAAIHVLTEEESTDVIRTAKVAALFCIPNGVDLDDYPTLPLPRQTCQGQPRRIGYLGRISPEKNLYSLCAAFERLNHSREFQLQLAGPITAFGRQLQERFSASGVQLVGGKFGPEKEEFIRALDLFVHPSLADVFSISAMEVLALGTPLLITRTAQPAYFFDRGAFFMCEPTEFGLHRGLIEALRQSAHWGDMAVRGRKLVEQTFNWGAAAEQMIESYAALVQKS